MTLPPSTNSQRITEALNILRKSLRAFIEERMRSVFKEHWLEKITLSLTDLPGADSGQVTLDVHALIRVATDPRHKVLYNALSPRDRNLLHELRDVRVKHASQIEFEAWEVERVLDTLELFLTAIRSPQPSSIELLRQPAPAPNTSSVQPAPAPGAVATTAQLAALDDPGIQRGLRLFHFFADQANRGRAVGISYADFIAFIHGKTAFHELAGRKFLPSDTGTALTLASSVTDANAGRIAVTAGGKTIDTGMDTYIWAASAPWDRPEKAFLNPKHSVPYSRADWKAVFPDALRRMIRPAELASLR